jgi:hypothetical protein
MNVQWTYKDLRTKSSIIRDVLSWKIITDVQLNRGTYRDIWQTLPMQLGTPVINTALLLSGQITPDDGAEVFSGALATESDYPKLSGAGPDPAWTGDAVGKIRVTDDVMHIAPRTKYENVLYLAFYDGEFVETSTLGTLVSGVTGVAATDILTLVAHGLTTGQQVRYLSGTGFDGYTVDDEFFVAKLTADTFYLCATLADALALTPVNFTVNGSAGVFVTLATTDEPSGNVVGYVELSQIVAWNKVDG